MVGPTSRATRQVAGVILEGVVGNSGFIVPDKAFLTGLRQLCTKHGALLVFDEVMTGFRISYGGAQKHFGITPDLSTFGKVIGGGLPVGAYAGKKKIMEMVAPAGPMYQAGTLSGNPLAMMAGIKTLEILKQPGTYKQLDEKTGKLINGILDAGKAAGHAVCGGHISGMFGFFFCEGPIKCALDSSSLPLSKRAFLLLLSRRAQPSFSLTPSSDRTRCFADAAANADTEKFAKWHRGMLERGVYLAPSSYEVRVTSEQSSWNILTKAAANPHPTSQAGFMSLAHSDEDIDKTIAAAKEVFATL